MNEDPDSTSEPLEDQPHICMDERVRYSGSSTWEKVVLRGKLTDQQIEKYERLGYYSAEFKQARREHMERVANRKKKKREGSFELSDDGRLIYRPL